MVERQTFAVCTLIRNKTRSHSYSHCFCSNNSVFCTVFLSLLLKHTQRMTVTQSHWTFAEFILLYSFTFTLFNHHTIENLRVITFSLCRTEYHFFLDMCGSGGSVLLVSASRQHLESFVGCLEKKMLASSGILPACPSSSTWAAAAWGHRSGHV